MKSLNCANCGAALPAHSIKGDLATCEFCGTTFRIPKTLTPEPEMGDLLLGADFSSDVMPGWEFFNRDKLTFHKGKPNELRGVFPQLPDQVHYVLKSSGLLDDFDASVTIRVTEGDDKMLRSGFYPRFNDDGGYTVMISAISTYQVGVFTVDKDNKWIWRKIIPWTLHTALKPGLHQNNRLRVICNRDQFLLYFNGVLATSFKDPSFSAGKLCIIVDPFSPTSAGYAFSDLQLREAK
jgi:hypothetical protein